MNDREKLINKDNRKSTVNDIDPHDHYNLIYIICIILGLGTLLAYNMMVTASDFLTTEYEDYPDIMFWVVPAYSVPNVIFTLLMIKYGSTFSFSTRIIWSFLTTAAIIGLIPFIAQKVNEKPSYDLIMGICAFIGFSAAILQATTIGFTNLLPGKYTQANIAGQSLAGIIACIVRILTKALEPNNDNGYISGGWFYFISGAIGDLICAVAFIYVIKTVFVKHHLKGYMQNSKSIVDKQGQVKALSDQTMAILVGVEQQQDYGDDMTIESDDLTRKGENKTVSNDNGTPNATVSNLDQSLIGAPVGGSVNALSQSIPTQSQQIIVQTPTPTPTPLHPQQQQQQQGWQQNYQNNDNSTPTLAKTYHISTDHTMNKSKQTADFKTVWMKVRRPAIALFSLFVVTFLIFPGLITGIDSQYASINNGSWMPVILIFEFNICDYIGRQFFASWTSFGFDASNLWIACVSRIVIYPLFLCLYEAYLVNDIVAHAAMIVFAISNGHFCCLAFIYAPGLVEDYEQESCAAIMSSALVSGIFVGAGFALVITYAL